MSTFTQVNVGSDPRLQTIAAYLREQRAASPPPANDVVSWGERNFYIPAPNGTGRPRLIKFAPHQRLIMQLMFDPQVAAQLLNADLNFQTLVYSTVKKSGKTAVAALVARWITETWGSHAEVFSLANDLEQARGRIYQAAITSIELDPRHDRSAKGIPSQWRVIEREARYLPTFSTLKAVSSDYKGEAGSNPTATLWSELWGYTSEASMRLFEELTPVPTRPRSIRYIETYAGYENESAILNDLEDRLTDPKNGSYRLTREHLNALGFSCDAWPFPPQEPLPFFVHPQTRTFAYWDTGAAARRMPWQRGPAGDAYYTAQEAELRPSAYRRLHLNERVSSSEEFVPKEWIERLARTDIPLLTPHTPVVLGADASVTGDCTAICLVSRDPSHHDDVLYRRGMVWQPSPGRPLDYSQTIEPTIREWCRQYNVVQIAYDQYQLHDLMTRLRNDGVAWTRPFSQMGDRMIADKALFDMIRDQRFHYPTGEGANLLEHIMNCAAKIPADDNTRLRLVKKATKSKIDLAVATSMAASECKRLNL